MARLRSADLRAGVSQPMGHWRRRSGGASIPVMPSRSNFHPGSCERSAPRLAHTEGVNLSMNKLKVMAVGMALSAAMFLPAVAEAGARYGG